MKTKETQSYDITEHLSVIFCHSANNETKIIILFCNRYCKFGKYTYLETSDYIEPNKQLAISIIHEIISKALVFENCRKYMDFIKLFDIDNTIENKKTYEIWKSLYCKIQNLTLLKPSEHLKKINKTYPIKSTLVLNLLYKELNKTT